jgi:hypothetical protein
MPYAAADCTSMNIMPERPEHIRNQFDQLMNAARAVCDEFTGNRRGDGSWVFVPACRANADRQTNLLTVWPMSGSLKLDIRPRPPGVDGPQLFLEADLVTYQQRMAARFSFLQGL